MKTNQTLNDMNDTLKNTNLKKDKYVFKNFFSNFLKNPLAEIHKVATDSKNNFLKVAIIIFVVWLLVALFLAFSDITINNLMGSYGSFKRLLKNIFPNILTLISQLFVPILTVLLLSGLIYVFKKNKNTSFLMIASTVVIAKIPMIIANFFSFFTIFSSEFVKIASYLSVFCNILSSILLYFGIKELLEDSENKSYFWKYALIIGLFYIASFILSYLGIYL